MTHAPQYEKTKKRLIAYIRRNGLPIRTDRISRQVSIPPTLELQTLLAELVEEGRLIRKPTLLANGTVGHLYSARR